MTRAGMKRKMIMISVQANSTRKSARKHLRDMVGTAENLDMKQLNVSIKKVTKLRAQTQNLITERIRVL